MKRTVNIDHDRFDLEQFHKDLSELHIVLSQGQIDQFLTYYEMLIEKNKVMNLTAITDFDEVMKKHFIDSLSIVKVFYPEKSGGKISLIDIGTGAGFPGIPIKIAFPHVKITLLDSLNKRVQFLKDVIDALDLSGIEAIHGRAEDYAKPGKLREKYDICVSRAVADLSVLAEYCLPYVKKGGQFISYKSEKAAEEIRKASGAISILGGKIDDYKEFTLPGSDIKRSFVQISKQKQTPLKYPRKAGMASKDPLK